MPAPFKSTTEDEAKIAEKMTRAKSLSSFKKKKQTEAAKKIRPITVGKIHSPKIHLSGMCK